MSLKNGPSPNVTASVPDAAPWSLAARLTLWFFVTSFSLVLVATGYLYWALAQNLDREDDHYLTDRTKALIAVLRDRSADLDAIRQQVEWGGAVRPDAPIALRVLGERGRIIAETPGMSEILPPTYFPAAVMGHGNTLRGEEHRSTDGRSFRVLSVGEKSGPYVVQAAMDRSHEVELLKEYRRNLWIVLGVALVVCSVGAYQMIRRGIRPLKNIAETAGGIGSSTLDERIAVAGLPAELRTLADTFNAMLDRLESSFDRLSQFSADIAHELRTPLNNLRGEAEVALSRPRSLEDYRDVIGSALEEYGRLSRMIDSLLFVARAEDHATLIACESLDVGEEVERLREYYEATAAEGKVRLNVVCPATVTATLDRTLFQRAVGNLVENALAHTPPDGAVTLTALAQDCWFSLDVADTGHGIDPAHLPHLFDRFYRADRARRSRNGSNVGLGLAIVKSIAELHGGTVEIYSELGLGTRIRLCFPKTPISPYLVPPASR